MIFMCAHTKTTANDETNKKEWSTTTANGTDAHIGSSHDHMFECTNVFVRSHRGLSRRFALHPARAAPVRMAEAASAATAALFLEFCLLGLPVWLFSHFQAIFTGVFHDRGWAPHELPLLSTILFIAQQVCVARQRILRVEVPGVPGPVVKQVGGGARPPSHC